MTTKKKIWLVLGGFSAFLALLLLLFLLTSGDISNEKLGPSPFNVDESIVSDNNVEYQTISELGKKVQGYEDLTKNYELDLYDPQPTIFKLLAYLEENEGLIEQADLKLFQKVKFPKLNVHNDTTFEYFRHLLSLIQIRIFFNILTKDHENAKADLILSSQISDELIKKASNYYIGELVLSNKTYQLSNINLLINHSDCTVEQKLEILNLKYVAITSQYLKNIVHFDIEFFQAILQNLNNPTEKRNKLFLAIPYIPIINPLLYQPNKSARVCRKQAFEIIDLLEKPSFNSYSNITEIKPFDQNYTRYLKANCLGGLAAEQFVGLIKRTVAKQILSINNRYNQLFIAQQILLYKTKNGSLPKTLADLGVAKELYTDILTGEPFLYYEPNGILQSLGRNKKNCNEDLTTKPLTPEEIHDILCATHQERDFILYLK